MVERSSSILGIVLVPALLVTHFMVFARLLRAR